jgi:hypothetical protein
LLACVAKVGVGGLRADEREISLVFDDVGLGIEEESATVGGIVQSASCLGGVRPSIDPVVVHVPQIKPTLVMYDHVVQDEARAYHVVNVCDAVCEDGELQKAESLLEHSEDALHDLAR